MKKLLSDFRLQVSKNMPARKWEIYKLLDEFSKELSSRERCGIYTMNNQTNKSLYFLVQLCMLVLKTTNSKRIRYLHIL